MSDTVKAWIEERRTMRGFDGWTSEQIVKAELPRALDALNAVLELHKQVSRYTAYGYEEFSFMSIKDAHDFIGEPVELDEFKLCDECMRIEDGADDNAREIGYETSLYPCPTVQAIEGAINE